MKTLIYVVLIAIALALGIKAAISEESNYWPNQQQSSEQQFQSELIQAIKHLNTEYQAQHYLSPEQYQSYQERYSPQYAPQYQHQYDNRYR